MLIGNVDNAAQYRALSFSDHADGVCACCLANRCSSIDSFLLKMGCFDLQASQHVIRLLVHHGNFRD